MNARQALSVALWIGVAVFISAEPAAPYVSKLVAKAGPQSVLLSWSDPVGWPGATYEIWRADKELAKETLAKAEKLGTVAAGAEAFQDRTVTKPSYYLVLLREADGTRHTVFVPFRNKTSSPVGPDPSASLTVAAIRSVHVTYAPPRLVIAFSAQPTGQKLSVYRHTEPFRSVADLSKATLVGTVLAGQGQFADTPPPGLSFYYAVVDPEAVAIQSPDALSAGNVTDQPAGFPLLNTADLPPPAPQTQERPLPLPLLDVTQAPDTGAPLAPPPFVVVPPQTLTPGAEQALHTWAKESVRPLPDLPDFIVLPEEKVPSQSLADQTLAQIRRAYFEPRDWSGAQKALEIFLEQPLPVPVEIRARFYHGEVLAQRHHYRQAFLDLLIVRDAYPEEAQPLLDALFSLLDSGQE